MLSSSSLLGATWLLCVFSLLPTENPHRNPWEATLYPDVPWGAVSHSTGTDWMSHGNPRRPTGRFFPVRTRLFRRVPADSMAPLGIPRYCRDKPTHPVGIPVTACATRRPAGPADIPNIVSHGIPWKLRAERPTATQGTPRK